MEHVVERDQELVLERVDVGEEVVEESVDNWSGDDVGDGFDVGLAGFELGGGVGLGAGGELLPGIEENGDFGDNAIGLV